MAVPSRTGGTATSLGLAIENHSRLVALATLRLGVVMSILSAIMNTSATVP